MRKILFILFLFPIISSGQKTHIGVFQFDSLYTNAPYNSGAGIVHLGIDTVASSPTFGKLVRKTASGSGENFANTNLTFTADRIHDANYFDLEIDNLDSWATFTGSATRYSSVQHDSLYSKLISVRDGNSSSIEAVPDSVLIKPNEGNIYLDSLRTTVDTAVYKPLVWSKDNGSVRKFNSWGELGLGGTASLTATSVGYGSGSNLLTGTSNFVYDNSNKKLILIDGSADSYIEVGNAGGTFKTTISGAGFTSISTGFLSVLEQSTPATPSGRGIFYFKSDNLPYALNDAGTEMALYNTGGGMADPGGNGIVVRTALNTTTNRTLTGTTNEISVANGDGTGGNPTFSIPATFDLSTKSVRIDDLKDPSGNTILGVNYTASANNYLQIDNSNGGSPILSAVGGATDISMNFQMKGAGFYNFLATSSGPTALDLYEDTDNGTNFAQLTVPSSLGSNVTITLPNASSTLPIFPQQITFTGPTAARTVTYPDANFTVARTDAAQTFTGSQSFASEIVTNTAVTASGNAATVAVTASLTTVTNNSAATLTITMATASAVDGQISTVRILDATAATQTITWVNTENSSITAPTTSNGSTTLFLTVKFIYNSATSKWRCIGYA